MIYLKPKPLRLISGRLLGDTLQLDDALKKISDESIILGLLNNAKENPGEVYIWRLLGGSKHLASVKIESIRRSRGDFCITPLPGHEKSVQDLLSSNDYIDLYVPHSAILLRCHIKQTHAPARYYLELPSFIAQVERRKSLRLNVYESEEASINFKKTSEGPFSHPRNFKRPCYDISSHGFSFMVSRMESRAFKLYDSLRAVELKIGNQSILLNAQVLIIKEVLPDELNRLPYKAWRVCCRITQIDEISLKYLERYVFERINQELHVINM